MERVHRELLAERLPPALVTRRIWEERFSDINAFVRHPRAQRHCMIVISSTLAVGPIAEALSAEASLSASPGMCSVAPSPASATSCSGEPKRRRCSRRSRCRYLKRAGLCVM